MTNIIESLIAKGKHLGFDQKDLSLKIGMTSEAFSRAKKRGDLKFSDLESLASAVESEIIFIDKLKDESRDTRKRIEDIGLSFPYDWSKGEMSDDLIIKKVLERFIFHDVVLICCHFGISFIEKIHQELNPTQPQHELDTLRSIKEGINE